MICRNRKGFCGFCSELQAITFKEQAVCPTISFHYSPRTRFKYLSTSRHDPPVQMPGPRHQSLTSW